MLLVYTETVTNFNTGNTTLMSGARIQTQGAEKQSMCKSVSTLYLLPGQHSDPELRANSHWQEWCREGFRGCFMDLEVCHL